MLDLAPSDILTSVESIAEIDAEGKSADPGNATIKVPEGQVVGLTAQKVLDGEG